MKTIITTILWLVTIHAMGQNWKEDVVRITEWFAQDELHVDINVQREEGQQVLQMGKASIDKSGNYYRTLFNENEMVTNGKQTLLIDHGLKTLKLTQMRPTDESSNKLGGQDFEKLEKQTHNIKHLGDQKGLRTYYLELNDAMLPECWITIDIKTGALITYAYSLREDPTDLTNKTIKISSNYQERKQTAPIPINQIIQVENTEVVGLGKYSTYKCSKI